jgi:hypothetical protein
MTTRVKDPGQAAGPSRSPVLDRSPTVLMNMTTHFGTIERAIDYAVTRGLNPEHWRIVEAPEGVRLLRQQEDRRAETRVTSHSLLVYPIFSYLLTLKKNIKEREEYINNRVSGRDWDTPQESYKKCRRSNRSSKPWASTPRLTRLAHAALAGNDRQDPEPTVAE